ncbi:hypothetical protein AQ616_18415 [Oceanobacillus sp. E9]|uniref:hypothetical protein n=1 Tax=Oceanobacillus sp. E9 TaxID=1742575 RepID=UPI00084E8EB5|nr:hypothetical protein [Oceanobacillus sp. E9]OEH53014.1 hypothetical protein AQ616_18415 [Oceanobacillus sp. E9]
MSDHLQNSIVSFAETARSQEDKGISKYGKKLDPLDGYDWLQMAKEEQVDGFQYLEAEAVKRKHIATRIRALIEHSTLARWSKSEINHLLDELEGIQ